MSHVMKFTTSRVNGVDPFTFVGDEFRLFYNPDTKSIRISDGTTPGGLPIAGGSGGSSAEAIYSISTPPATPNGLMWYNPNTDTLSVASAGSWIPVNDQVSTAIFTNVTPAATTNGLIWYNPDTNQLAISDTGAWVTITGASSLADLSDVTLTTPAAGDALMYQSGSFRNVPLNLTGGATNQILVKKSGSNYDYQWEDMIINLPDQTYTKLLDQASSTVLYLGEAVPDSLENQAVWRIQKILFDVNGDVDAVRYAEGGLFNQIWNNRASLVYI